MINAYDCDSHVWEGDHTFADRYWTQRYRGRRLLVVESDVQGNLSSMVDSLSFPRITGPGPVLGGNPVSKQGVPSEQFVRSTGRWPLRRGTWTHSPLVSSIRPRTGWNRWTERISPCR